MIFVLDLSTKLFNFLFHFVKLWSFNDTMEWAIHWDSIVSSTTNDWNTFVVVALNST